MQRPAMMMGVIALSCVGMAQPAEAQRRPMGITGSGFSFSFILGRGFERFESPAFERREEFFEHRRFFDRNRLFGFGVFPYYPYYATNYPAYYPSAAAVPPEGSSAALGPPSTQVADRPPCRETTEGVVVVRGTGCARSKP